MRGAGKKKYKGRYFSESLHIYKLKVKSVETLPSLLRDTKYNNRGENYETSC